MPQTTTKPRPVAKAPTIHRPETAAAHSATAVDRTQELSEGVLESVEAAQRAAIEAVRKFVATVDQALPGHGEGPSRRQEVVDSAMEMADHLVHTQYDFIRKVIQDAGNVLSKPSS
jgi:hypothetical protein